MSGKSRLPSLLLASAALFAPAVVSQSASPSPISLDEYLSTTQIAAARVSPDGLAAVIETLAPDWEHSRFRSDLWLLRPGASLLPLTQSGHESSPAWSPDGRFLAFLSDRPIPDQAPDDKASRVWILPLTGGEAVPLYREKLDTSSFAWSADSASLYLAITAKLTNDQQDAEKKAWKDVKRMREQERGDWLLRIPAQPAFATATALRLPSAAPAGQPGNNALPLPAGATLVLTSPLAIDTIVPAPDGRTLAFLTASISHRLERLSDFEIYLLPAGATQPRQLTHNQAREGNLHWSPDSKRLYFGVGGAAGSAEGPYQDVQGRIYAIDLDTDRQTRLGAAFNGSLEDFTITASGTVLACGLLGLEQHLYRVTDARLERLDTAPGTYGGVEAPLHGSAVLFTRSAINQPTQVYLAEDSKHIATAAPLTHFNPGFAQRAPITFKPFTWKAPDGMPVEGILLYPPGQENARHLKMLTLIHGGPGDADGNRFGADWYDWAALAASQGWLVFRPNYRGSTGYGDAFMLGISPHLVSVPGKDILAGVDALVAQGLADPGRLAIGGYSYGGYMTNWLITQTTRFKAAVTGAGAVEHAANWGNDDLTFDDAWYLGGPPWTHPALYTDEAALFRMDKITTPTHIVGGDADIRVSYFEDVAQERALETLGVPHTLLTFPGEGHPLSNNPWHGYIKVRDELEWLDKYVPPAR